MKKLITKKKIKNLQIGDNDLVGNKFNGHDLHIYLNKIGIESNHLIANKPQSRDKKTFQIGDKYSQKLREILIEVDKHYSLIGGTHTLPYDIMYNKLFLDCDVVHMHLIHNYMFNFNLLPLMTSLKPTVWTLHDPFMLTGHCIHPGECKKWMNGCFDCPNLKTTFKMKKDNTAFNWEMKRIALQNSQLTLIVASKWMENLVKQSPLFKHCNVHLIPFGVNQDIFKPADIREAKKKLKIDSNSITIMFRMDDNEFKGGDLLLKALPNLKSSNDKKITLITVGNQKTLLKHLSKKFNVLEYGWVSDDKKLAELYQACDMFIMPSKVETFGMMAIEAMSVGKPVIVLKGTALPDVVNAPNIGIACDRNAKALNEAIQILVDNPAEMKKRGQLSYKFALKEYGLEKYVKKIVDVYQKVIQNHKSSYCSKKVIEQIRTNRPINKISKSKLNFK